MIDKLVETHNLLGNTVYICSYLFKDMNDIY